MTWNNRVIDHGTYFGLHEVHYAPDGSVQGWTHQPMLVADSEEGVDGLIFQLERALRDVRERGSCASIARSGPVMKAVSPHHSLATGP